jgi:bifunctional oligoribonuclease and PAP phosphatase NrnA
MSSVPAPDGLLKALRNGQRFVLTGHRRPDGDSLGSALGLARILRQIGKGAQVWNRDPMPSAYAALAGSDRIHVGEEPPKGFPEAFDYAVCLECPTLERTGLATHLGALPALNLDHHLGNELYGEVNWIDTGAPALGEMMYRLAGALGVDVDAATATALYTAVMTDTGGFRFGNATARAFEVAAAMVRDGARPEQVSQWIYESQPLATLRLLGEMLPSLRLHHDGKIATVWLLESMFERAGATATDAEDLVDYPRSIAGVEAVALLRQQGPDSFKGSLRSRGPVDVEAIARSYGGGGHKNAAGFETTGDPEELTAALVERLRKALA